VGLDTSRLRSKDLGDFLGKMPIHHAIIVCEAANEQCPRLHPFALHLHYWPFPDPVAVEGTYDERLAGFRSVRDALEERIRRWLEADHAADAAGTRTRIGSATSPPRTYT
jgi:arsenate reductase